MRIMHAGGLELASACGRELGMRIVRAGGSWGMIEDIVHAGICNNLSHTTRSAMILYSRSTNKTCYHR